MITKQFIHLHFPRSGGTSLRHVLCSKFKDQIDILNEQNHPLLEDIRALAPDVPRFIIARNPWSWYVSWYLHCVEVRGYAFSFEQHLEECVNEIGKDSLCVPHRPLGGCSESFNGFTADGVEDIGFFRDVPNVYAEFVSKYSGIEYDAILAVLKKVKLRPSYGHADSVKRHYSTWYTERTRDMVLYADREYIQRFMFEFEEEPV